MVRNEKINDVHIINSNSKSTNRHLAPSMNLSISVTSRGAVMHENLVPPYHIQNKTNKEEHKIIPLPSLTLNRISSDASPQTLPFSWGRESGVWTLLQHPVKETIAMTVGT